MGYQRKMRTTTAICALFALLAVATAARRGVYTPPTAGKRYTSDSFDFLLFVQQWPGTLWNTAPKGVDGFTIHGLWPNNNDTGGPSFCTSATFDPSEVSSLLDELNVQWPSNQGDNEAFWAHEYEKHGTCAAVLPSLKTEYDFFSSVLQLNTKYDLISALADADIYPSWDKTYTLDAIKTALGDAGMPPAALLQLVVRRVGGHPDQLDPALCLQVLVPAVPVQRSDAEAGRRGWPLQFPGHHHPADLYLRQQPQEWWRTKKLEKKKLNATTGGRCKHACLFFGKKKKKKKKKKVPALIPLL